MQFIAIEYTPLGINVIGGKFGFQYSIGSLLPSGAHFYVDLIGIGVNVMGIESPYPFYSVKLLGFQHNTSNGFYWGLRSKLTISHVKSLHVKFLPRSLSCSFERTNSTIFLSSYSIKLIKQSSTSYCCYELFSFAVEPV